MSGEREESRGVESATHLQCAELTHPPFAFGQPTEFMAIELVVGGRSGHMGITMTDHPLGVLITHANPNVRARMRDGMRHVE